MTPKGPGVPGQGGPGEPGQSTGEASPGKGGFIAGGVWGNPFSAAAGGPDGRGTDPATGQTAPEAGDPQTPEEPVRAALVLPLNNAERVANVLAVARIELDLVPVEGVGLVAPLGEMLEAEAQARAQLASRTLRRVGVVLLLATPEQAVAQLWHSGARGADPRAGLLLSTWPDTVLNLLLGRTKPLDVPGAVTSAGRGRWAAFFASLRGAR